jgi:hypothetical protein
VLFDLYVSHLEGLHARLVAAGARPGPIGAGATASSASTIPTVTA